MLLGARYYHPSVGRFLARDPLRYGGGDPNLYRYCNNNPVNATDPTGCFAPVLIGLAIGIAVAYLAVTVHQRNFYVEGGLGILGGGSGAVGDTGASGGLGGSLGIPALPPTFGGYVGFGTGYTPTPGWYVDVVLAVPIGPAFHYGPLGSPEASLYGGIAFGMPSIGVVYDWKFSDNRE